jgi:hypothetical protein
MKSISRYNASQKLDAAWCGGAFTVGKDSGPIRTITDFEIDTDGNIYILDEASGVISKYTNDGNIDKGWGSQGSIGNINNEGKAMLDISDIVFDADGSMYVRSDNLSDGNAIIAKLNTDLTLDGTWGADVSGGLKGYITGAGNSIAAHNGYLYVEPSVDGAAIYGLIRLDSKGVKDPVWKITTADAVWDIKTDSSGNIVDSFSMLELGDEFYNTAKAEALANNKETGKLNLMETIGPF